MNVTSLAIVELVVLLAAATFGVMALVRWARHHRASLPIGRVVTHLTLQVVAIVLWLMFVIAGDLTLAWVAFATLTVGQVFGDQLMFASYRARHPQAMRPRYLTMGAEVLSFTRRIPGFHVWFGALAWLAMLALCVGATLTG